MMVSFLFISDLLLPIEEMILKYNPGFDRSRIRDVDYLREACGRLGVKGEANSLAAYQYSLDRLFQLNNQQMVYLALGDDTPSQRLIERLARSPFLVVQASYASPATTQADIVLPAEMWAEQEGHYLHLEGRLQTAHRGLTPPEEVRSNLDILDAIAAQMEFSLDDNWRAGLNQRVPTNAITMNV